MSPRIAIGAIGFDGTGVGGLNRYTDEVLRSLLGGGAGEGAVAYTSVPTRSAAYAAEVRVAASPRYVRNDLVGNSLRLAWHQLRLPGLLREDGADVFYSPVPEGMLRPALPQVITVHDLLPLHYPAVYPRLRHYFRLVLPRLVRASRAVVVDSAATERDLREMVGCKEVPIHVVYPGCSAETFRPAPQERIAEVRARFGLGEYLLFVGEARPYKNLARLIEAFSRTCLTGLQLAIVGGIGPRDGGVRELPSRFGVGERVRFLGRQPDAELAALYSGAEAFVFPSLYEGFGIPPLEAMACGCAVVASDAASIPEVCGEAACYIDPHDVDSIAAGMERVVGDSVLRRRLREAGLSRAARFSYRLAGDQIRTVLRTAVEG
jgi:glycosyltransferase involved in cell wall biosynthesis